MRHPRPFSPRFSTSTFLAVGLLCLPWAWAWTGCGGCEDDGRVDAEEQVDEELGEQVEEVRTEDVAGEVPPPDTRLPSAAGDIPRACLDYCNKSLECAEAGGHPIPEGARDCEESCAPDGIHRVAPPSVWACADRPCGTAFQSCSVQAMMEHQRGSEIGAFPMTCEGLCNKAAWCAERTGAGEAPGLDDCAAACRPGGAFADVPEGELRCVEAACGVPFDRCRQAGGPASP